MSDKTKARICVPVCVRSAQELPRAFERAALLSDLIELRLDCLPADEMADALRHLPQTYAHLSQPLMLTLRPPQEGGDRPLAPDERTRFWLAHAPSLLQAFPPQTELFFDVELDLLESDRRETLLEALGRIGWHRLICSFHDFDGVPADLEAIYERMSRTAARVLKIAVRAETVTDCIAVFRLLARARGEGREMIAIAMGAAGIPTRILAPSRGAFLTFGASDDATQTAPGQLTAETLRSLYRIDSINEQTEIYGLVGSPVTHSLSPHMHNAAFAAAGLNAVYLPFDVSDAGEFLRRMAAPRTRELNWNLRGLSVTAPHKSAVLSQLDWVETAAREIGAVNTIVFAGKEARGYNTDAAGFLAPLAGVLDLKGARAAVVGAGGAARAALWALRGRGAHVTLFARDARRASATAEAFGATPAALEGTSFDGFDLVVNATPLGTRGTQEEETPALSTQLRGAGVVYDLVYNPSETRLLREAREAGCRTIGGLAMLVAQACEQFKLWTGREAPRPLMHRTATQALEKR